MNALRGQTAVVRSRRLRFFFIRFDETARPTPTRGMPPTVAVQLSRSNHPPVQGIGTANAQQVPLARVLAVNRKKPLLQSYGRPPFFSLLNRWCSAVQPSKTQAITTNRLPGLQPKSLWNYPTPTHLANIWQQ